jgi:hypothetical protein
MPKPEKHPKDDPKPELGAILPDSTPPTPAEVFSELDDYQRRIETDFETAKNSYKDKIDKILDEFMNQQDMPRSATSSSPSPRPSFQDPSSSSVESRMEHLLERVERTLHPGSAFRRPSIINISWQPFYHRRHAWLMTAGALLLGAAFLIYMVAQSPKAIALPYTHPSTLVFASDRVYIIDWFRKVLYQHSYKTDLPILQVENIPNNFITGCALSDKYLWTLDGFNHQILQHSLANDHRVLKQFPSPGKKPAGLFWDGSDLWSSDEDEKKIYRHYGTDPETIKNEYSFSGLNITSLYYRENRLWILDGKSRMVYLFRLEDPLRALATYDLDPLLNGATPTDFMLKDGKFWMLTEGPPQLLRFSRRSLDKLKAN